MKRKRTIVNDKQSYKKKIEEIKAKQTPSPISPIRSEKKETDSAAQSPKAILSPTLDQSNSIALPSVSNAVHSRRTLFQEEKKIDTPPSTEAKKEPSQSIVQKNESNTIKSASIDQQQPKPKAELPTITEKKTSQSKETIESKPQPPPVKKVKVLLPSKQVNKGSHKGETSSQVHHSIKIKKINRDVLKTTYHIPTYELKSMIPTNTSVATTTVEKPKKDPSVSMNHSKPQKKEAVNEPGNTTAPSPKDLILEKSSKPKKSLSPLSHNVTVENREDTVAAKKKQVDPPLISSSSSLPLYVFDPTKHTSRVSDQIPHFDYTCIQNNHSKEEKTNSPPDDLYKIVLNRILVKQEHERNALQMDIFHLISQYASPSNGHQPIRTKEQIQLIHQQIKNRSRCSEVCISSDG